VWVTPAPELFPCPEEPRGQGSLSFQILGNTSEFQRVVEVLQDNVDFDIDVNASVFETNIRGKGCFLGPVGEIGVVTDKQNGRRGLQESSFQGTAPD
jgi:hypothetical protein